MFSVSVCSLSLSLSGVFFLIIIIFYSSFCYSQFLEFQVEAFQQFIENDIYLGIFNLNKSFTTIGCKKEARCEKILSSNLTCRENNYFGPNALSNYFIGRNFGLKKFSWFKPCCKIFRFGGNLCSRKWQFPIYEGTNWITYGY